MKTRDYMEVLGRFSIFSFIFGFFINETRKVSLALPSLIFYLILILILFNWALLPYPNSLFVKDGCNDMKKERQKFKKQIKKTFYKKE